METILPTTERPLTPDGKQRIYRFDNGYGASAVQRSYSYGGTKGLWELGVIEFDGADWRLTYDTPITDDVIGWLDEDGVQETLRRIRDLPRPGGAR